MESIRKTAECVERRFGEALGTRDTTVSSLKKQSGLGPPDMCWLQKRVKKAFRKKSEVRGSYHWLVGLDIRGEASIKAYFNDLVSNLEKPGFFQGLVPREYTIDRGIICCHDPFSSVDIWCDVEASGQMMSRSIDLDGNIVSANTWSGARLGCFLRSELYDSATTISSTKSLRRLKIFSTHREEDNFLDFVIDFYKEGIVQKCLEHLQWDKALGLEPEDMDIVSGTILHYFRRSQRWQKALQFFTRLQEYYPPAGVYLCVVYRELDNPDGAMAVLKSCVEEKGHHHPSLLLAYGKQALLTGKIEFAFEMAKKSIGKAQTARPAWFLLQKCFSSQKNYSLSLKTLNLMPGPFMPDEKEAIFRSFPPEPKSVTKPGDRQYDPELTELRRTLFEGKQTSSTNHVQMLPARIIAPSQVGNCGVLANCAPAYCTQAATLKSYRILLSIVRQIGWENFIAMRSELFIVADVALQGQSSLSRAKDSLKLGRPKETPYISVNISELDSMADEKSLQLISVSLDVANGSSLETVQSSPAVQPTTQELFDEAANVGAASDNEPLEEKIDTGGNETSSEESTVLSHGHQSETHVLIDKSHSSEPKMDLQKGGMAIPHWQRVTLPKRALESSEYLEKLRGRAENDDGTHLLKSLTPRRSEPSPSPSVDPVRVVEQETAPAPDPAVRKRFPLPPPSPVSSLGSEALGMGDKDGDRWLVKEVSLGIKDRVRYFESMASKKAEEEAAKLAPEKEEEAVKSLKPVSSRKGTSMTMMEFLTAGWDENVPSAMENTPRQEAMDKNEESECDESTEGETQYEDGTVEGSASQTAIKQGWLSVEWEDSVNGRNVDEDNEKRQSHDVSSEPEPPTSPFLMEAHAKGIDVGLQQCNDDDEGPDGSWIVEILEGLEKCECSEWLDELIMALWEDLAVYTELRRIDRKMRGKTGKCVAEWILGTDEGNYACDSLEYSQEKHEKIEYTGEMPSLPKTTAGDWMFRGMLCERLERIPEAEQAYRVSMFKGFNLTSLLGLARIYSSWGWSRESMQVLSKLAEFHDRYHESLKDHYIPQSMSRAVSKLVTCVGNIEVRASAAKSHPMVKCAVDEVLKWQRRSGQE